jgi:hypothetical protein
MSLTLPENQPNGSAKSLFDSSPNTELAASTAIEAVRRQFPPEIQNALGVLVAAIDPLPIEKLAEYASNHDGHGAGNPVEVSLADVTLLINVLQQAEQKYGLVLLEQAPITDSTSGVAVATSMEMVSVTAAESIDPNAMSQTIFGFKMVEPLQQLIKQRYYDLWVEFNKMFANRMWFDLGMGEEQEFREDLIPAGQELGALIDESAEQLRAVN